MLYATCVPHLSYASDVIFYTSSQMQPLNVAFKFKFKSTGKGKPVACGPGAISHSSAFLRNRNNVKQCIQTIGMPYQKQGEK